MSEIREYIKIILQGSKKWHVFFVGEIVVFLLLLAIIFFGWYHMICEISVNTDTESQSESVPNFGTDNQTTKAEENVPNFGTSISVLNMEEKVEPILEEQSVRLQKELTDYVSRNKMDESECTIIHVMIPEQNEKQLFFFCKFSFSGEVVQVVFDREKDVFITLKSYYTEEEIVSEIWNGACPTDRDIQE